jgi:hypothetical protein
VRKYVQALLFCLVAVPSIAQKFGNEWIRYSQKYYRIPISKEGIYRIDSLTLAKAGVPLSNINPRNFQLFERGNEQYIYIKGEADGVFNWNDTIEFYARPNDGFLDSTLYPSGTIPPNPYVSLFNDTAAYYLTWNSSLQNHRMIMSSDTGFASFTPLPYFFKEVFYATMSDYFQGTTDQSNVTDPEYLPMESVVCSPITYGQNFSAPIRAANAYAPGPAAILSFRVLTRTNDFAVFPDYHIQVQFPGGTFDTLVDGYMTFLHKVSIAPGSLTASTPVTLYSINPGASATTGDAAFSFVSLRYPHTPDLEGSAEFKMNVPGNNPQSKAFLNLSGFTASGLMRFYDLTYHRRITAQLNSGYYRVLLSDSLNSEKFCYAASENAVHLVTSLTPVNGNGTFTDFHQQALDSAFVIVTNPALLNSAESYKLYRSSAQGGSNHVILADVTELFDQFAYGVRQHPLSIRNFCAYLSKSYPTKPKYLFLLGKSIDGVTQRFSPTPLSLVPTMGYPPSDMLFTSKLNSASYAPTLATGRLAASSNADVMTYLNKVTAYEQNTPANWMKQVLHFGGGNSSGEQAIFRAYLQKYKTIIEADTNFGGHVISFFKTSSAPIQINQSDSLKQLIDNGVSIMTFFGHASGSGFDQSIDDPSNYNNAPHFPLIIANSCYAGDIHTTSRSTSEKFILNSRGAIGFIASTYLGLSGELDPYTTGIYKSLSRYNYGKSIGKHMQYAVHAREQMPGFGLYSKLTVLSMTLHGDPALVIASPRLPDYEISDSDLSFDTHSQGDTVTIMAVMHNHGKAVIDSFFVRMQRKFPNGDSVNYKKVVAAPAYQDTLRYKIPVDFSRGIGLNKISVALDYTNRTAEMYKNNNATGDVTLVIQGSAVLPVWPYNDAIVAYDTITLKASSANPFEVPHDYRVEIDTTDRYNSPSKLSIHLLSKPGGIISWKPSLLLKDSTVYFWRISPDSTNAANPFRWKESSFQYINGRHGWAQAHFFQFKNDGYQFVKFNRNARRFDFVNDIKAIQINNGIMYFNGIDWPDINYKINGTSMEESSCSLPGLSFAVLNPVSLKPWGIDTACSSNIVLPYNAPAGNTVCVCNTLLNAYDFFDTPASARQAITNFINAIPNGYYVFAWTNTLANNYDSISIYPPALINAFKSLGSGQIQSVPNDQAYILLGRKGWIPGQAKEVIGTSHGQKIQLNDTLITNWPNGYVASEVIGPAKKWSELHWRQMHLESPSTDSTVVRVLGITSSGKQVDLADFKDSTDVLDLGRYVDASIYPTIKLVAYLADNVNRTPAQIKRWQVVYTPVAELAVNPPLNFSFKKDTVQEGQNLTMTCAVQNISDFDLTDSLEISYWILDKKHVRHNILLSNNQSYKLRKPPLSARTFFIDTVQVNTTGYSDLNTFWMEVNPVQQKHSQYEEYHFNNSIQKPFYVSADKTNPLMDVTFDGVHILDGDIVSAKPSILISLKDENLYLALNDTSDFKLFLQNPNSTVALPVYFRNDIVFTPAALPKNSCRLNYTPVLKTDGVYTLIVQAKDRSKNTSGKLDYQIRFEVINHATITDVMNYPNPFTTATHFVFTITGSELPSTFRIQIMTITGKLVREIEKDELGPLHIGRNVTEYAWDGRDQFGDRLANGVYFYRVLTKINSENIEHMDNPAIDSYFKKGFGKMYLMH